MKADKNDVSSLWRTGVLLEYAPAFSAYIERHVVTIKPGESVRLVAQHFGPNCKIEVIAR